MISLYSGTPGSGKSFHMLMKGLYAARVQKRPVIANFPITDAPAHWHYVEHITVEVLVEYARTWKRRESQALLLIDEASRYFNSRDWQRKHDESMQWITFFSEHRKLGYDVILAAQGDRMLDRQVRLNIEMEKKHVRANRTFPFSLFPLPVFFVISSWYAVPTMKHKLALLFYRPWVGKRYDTMRLFHVGSKLMAGEGDRERGGSPARQQAPAPYRKVREVTRGTIDRNRGEDGFSGGQAAAPVSRPPERPEGTLPASVAGGVRLLPDPLDESSAKVIPLRNSSVT